QMVERQMTPKEFREELQREVDELEDWLKGKFRWDHHEAYKKAELFCKTPWVRKTWDYSWVRDYAKERLKQFDQNFDSLDGKADSIIKYLGGGTGIIAIASFLSSSPNKWIMLATLPSVLIAVA